MQLKSKSSEQMPLGSVTNLKDSLLRDPTLVMASSHQKCAPAKKRELGRGVDG